MTTIYLVRHGKTDDSGNRITGYRPGIYLNEEGVQQASLAGKFFESFPIYAVYSSPLERAIETAQLVVKNHNLTIQPVEFLKEINFGDYQGKGNELQLDPLWNKFLTTPTTMRFPNGESVYEAQSRIVEGLHDLCESSPSDAEILCISHCEVIRLAVSYALRIPLDEYTRITIDTGGISKVSWKKRVTKSDIS